MVIHGDTTGDTVLIPPLVLRGSRSERLIQLEGQLARLQTIRRTLVRDERPSVARTHLGNGEASARRWSLTGAAIVLALALLTLGGWLTRGDVTVAGSSIADVVRATR